MPATSVVNRTGYGAVYHHYGSKQALFERVAAAAQQRVARTVSAAADLAGGSWDGRRRG